MKKKFSREHKSAQQLIEFLLVAPFFVIIFGILTEYAYAFTVDMTLEFGLKKVTAEIYSQIKPNMDVAQIEKNVKTSFEEYLTENNVSTKSENNITVNSVSVGNNEMFIANYT